MRNKLNQNHLKKPNKGANNKLLKHSIICKLDLACRALFLGRRREAEVLVSVDKETK